jgi:hypothetical protein
MTEPLTIVCSIFRESGDIEDYKFANACLELLEDRTVTFMAKEMTHG